MSDSAGLAPISRDAWLALFVITLSTLLVVIDISAVNVAFPSIRGDFDVSDAALSWIVSGYNIAVGALILAAGRLADSRGRRKVFLPGVALFGLGSLLCGLAPSAGALIAARVLQGCGGAVATAAGFAVMLPSFPPSRRSTAIGIAGAMGALGSVIGPAVGSVIIDLWNWRGIFLINVPITVVILILGPRFLPESKDPNATGHIDVPSVVLGTLGVAMIMFAIVQSETWGLANPILWASLVVGLILLGVLLQRSRQLADPMLNLTLWQFPSFRSASLGTWFYSLGFTAGFLINSLMLQDLWNQPIRTVGLALMPSPALAGVVSIITGRLADRYGHRWLLGIGSALCGGSYLAYRSLFTETPQVFTLFVPLSLFVGLGVGLTIATWSSAGLSDIPAANFGVAGATYNTLRQVAYALGISVAIALVSWGGSESFAGFRAAYTWVGVCYLIAAVVVIITFPRGSSADRGLVTE